MVDALPTAYTSPVSDLEKTAKSVPGDGSPDLSVSSIMGAKQRTAAEEVKTLDALQKGEQDWRAKNPFPQPTMEPFKEKPPEAHPVEAFGSWASALGIIASLATKTPLTSALKASSAAMRASRENDLDMFEMHRQAWKDHTEYALKVADWQVSAYNEAFKGHEQDQVSAMARAKAVAAQTQDGAMMQLLDSGDLSKALQLQESMQRMTINGRRAAEDADQFAREKSQDIFKQNLLSEGLKEATAQNGGKPLSVSQQAEVVRKLTSAIKGDRADIPNLSEIEGALYQKKISEGKDPETALKEVKAAAAAPPRPETDKAVRDEQMKMRKALDTLPEIKNFGEMSEAKAQVDRIADKPRRNAVDDYQLMFSVLRTFNPKAVVRMQEIKTAEQAQGVPQAVVLAYNNALNGVTGGPYNLLSPQQEKNFIDSASGAYEAQKKLIMPTIQQYAGYAKKAGWNADEIIPAPLLPKVGEKISRGGKTFKVVKIYPDDPLNPEVEEVK